jgi:hypothetical protein
MQVNRDEVLNAALALSKADRLLVATRLMDTLPEDPPGLSWDDPGFLEELERRSQDRESAVPAAELWKEARP